MNPVTFYRMSKSYMQGYSAWYIHTRMPRAYARFCSYVLLDMMRVAGYKVTRVLRRV